MARATLRGSWSKLITSRESDPWRPWTLGHRALQLITLLLVLLASLVAALPSYVNATKKGIPLPSSSAYIHFIWTIPPPLIGTAINLTLTAISFKIQRIMPWLSLARASGGSGIPAKNSVKLDYPDVTFVPWRSLRNRHWVVFAASSAALFSAALSVALTPLMYVGPTVVDSTVSLSKVSRVGLARGHNDLEPHYAAMTGMTTSVRNSDQKELPAASPWVSRDGWAIGKLSFDPDINVGASSNISATVPAIRHASNCETTDVRISYMSDDNQGTSTFNITATGNKSGCVHNRNISVGIQCCDHNGQGCCDSWGGDVNPCGRLNRDGSPLDPSQQSFVFWTARMVSAIPTQLPNVSITICTPQYYVYPAVEILIDAKNNAILEVSPPSDTTLTGAPEIDPVFNGNVFNGYVLDWFNLAPGGIEADRKGAIRTGLLSAIHFRGEGNANVYANNEHFDNTNTVYSSYLAHVAHEVYFIPPNASTLNPSGAGDVKIHTEELRLFVNPTSAYVSCGILALLALGMLLASVELRRMRHIVIPRQEGTIHTSLMAAHGLENEMLDDATKYAIRTGDDNGGLHIPRIRVIPHP